MLYLGRIDPNKGCDALMRHFLRYVGTRARTVQLVMAGPVVDGDAGRIRPIRALGFVDDEVREALLTRARALVMPSPFESLSMVLLEAWNHGLPALVNARCQRAARPDGARRRRPLLRQRRRVRGGARLPARPPRRRAGGSARRDWRTSIANTAGRR